MRSRILPLAVWALALAIAILLVCRARYTADLSAFLPALPSQQQQLLVEELKEGPAARVILVAISGADAARRAALSAGLVQRLQPNPLFRTVTNGAAGPTEADQRFLYTYRYLLSDRIDAGFFHVERLQATIRDNIDLLASPLGMLSKDLFARDPTGETLQVITQLDRPDGPRLADGVWVSPDGQRALLVAETAAAGSDTDGQQRAMLAIRAAFDALQPLAPATAPSPAILRLTGPAVFAVDARATIEKEAVRLSLLSSLLIAAFLLAVYRSVRVLALGMLPVASGALAGVAAVALGFSVVHGVTLGFGVTLIGESVDYSVYLFLQGQARAGGGRDQARWTADFWPTVRLGMLTSVVGFASLLPSSFPGLAQLGAYSIAGLVAAALVTRFVLPQLLPANLAIADVAPLGQLFLRVVAPLRRVRALAWLVPVVAAACLLTHRGELWNHELSALSPVPAEAQAFDARLRADLGTADVRTLVVVSAASAESALQTAEQVGAALQPLVDGGIIAGFDSPARYLPSLRTQRARQAALPDPADLKARFLAATAALPLHQERFDGFLEDVAAARQLPLATAQQLQGTTQAAGVDALLVQRGAAWQALVPLEAMHTGPSAYMIDTGRVEAALGGLRSSDATVIVLDLKRESDALYSSYLTQSVRLSLAGLGAILVLLTVALRSLVRTLRVVVPLALAVLVVISGFVVVGHAMTILNLVGLLLVVAIGSNYCLFFDREAGHRGDADGARTLGSLTVANASTVIGFGVLATSSVPVLSAVGLTVAPGAFLALLFGALLAGGTAAAPGSSHA
jgi:predicted exporter